MSDKAFVFGRSGQLGKELVQVLTTRGYQVTAYNRAEADVTDQARLEQVISEQRPSVVFNATAYNMVDAAEREPEAAFAGNALAVRNFALACRRADTRLIHFSTDYVFDGTAGRPYIEEDTTHPLGAYAVSKLAGELYAQAYLTQTLIIRTCGVFGLAGLHTARGNFVETMLKLGQGTKPIRVVEDQVVSPTYAVPLASRAVDLLERELFGIFHVGGGLSISWHDYAAMIFEEAGLTPELHRSSQRDNPTPAARPQYSALSNAKMESTGTAPMPQLRECLKDYLAGREYAAARAGSPKLIRGR